MNNIFNELNELKDKLDRVNENRTRTPYPSDEHDKLTDEAIDIVNKIGCLAEILHIHCEARFKAYQEVNIPLRVARGGNFYYGKESK